MLLNEKLTERKTMGRWRRKTIRFLRFSQKKKRKTLYLRIENQHSFNPTLVFLLRFSSNRHAPPYKNWQGQYFQLKYILKPTQISLATLQEFFLHEWLYLIPFLESSYFFCVSDSSRFFYEASLALLFLLEFNNNKLRKI